MTMLAVMAEAAEPTWADKTMAWTGVVSMLLWAVYVLYTVKTFREIRRQTELQIEAFILVTSDVISRVVPKDLQFVDPGVQTLHAKWKSIIENNLPTALQGEDRLLKLRFSNRGKSDVVSWMLKIHLAIEPGSALAKNNITGESYDWIVRSDGSKHVVGPGEFVDVTISPIGLFPIAEISWTLSYVDSRGKQSERFAGDSRRTERNAFAAPSAT
jgi:hypothetical protein